MVLGMDREMLRNIVGVVEIVSDLDDFANEKTGGPFEMWMEIVVGYFRSTVLGDEHVVLILLDQQLVQGQDDPVVFRIVQVFRSHNIY